jgi:Tol biopolymer transport system component/DNA-binding winged helix-turn-helix (wHTH) protein
MTRNAEPSYHFGPFHLDLSEHVLLRDGQRVPLTPKVFDVLRLLVQNSGHLVTKEMLLTEVWPGSFVEEANINRSIFVLRKALGETSLGQSYIETVPKLGYRFVAPVAEVPLAGSESCAPTPDRVAVNLGADHVDSRFVRSRAVAGTVVALIAVGFGLYAVLGSREREKHAATTTPVHKQVTFTGIEGAPTLSPDGRRIAYVSYGSPERTVMVQELAGGRPLAIFSAPEVGRLRWSPDGSDLMFWSRGGGKNGIYVMPQLGGTPRRVAGGLFTACWSPDGSTIAVAQYLAAKISFLDLRTREPRTVSLTGVHRWIWDMDWSPITNQLVFASDDNEGHYSIWTMLPDGSDQNRILVGDTEISSARWAPGATSIYYSRRANETVSLNKLVRQPDDGKWKAVEAPLVSGLETDGSFAVSADGGSLVYSRSSFHSNLWTVEVSGSADSPRLETRELTHGTSLIERPRVSPDGKWIAFNIGRESRANVYVLPITGGSAKQLTFFNSFNVGPAWSPDGQTIAFISTESGKRRVWLVGANGGAARALSSDRVSDTSEVVWSTASRILYQQVENRNFQGLDLQSQQERPLVKDDSVGWLASPVPSPDGKRIAVGWNRRPTRGIWIIDGEEGRETPLYEAPVPPLVIGWSADGTSIYALDGGRPIYRGLVARHGETLTEAKILKVSVSDGKAQSIVLPFEEVGGVSMTPDGRTFVCTVYSSRSDVWVVSDFDTLPGHQSARR